MLDLPGTYAVTIKHKFTLAYHTYSVRKVC